MKKFLVAAVLLSSSFYMLADEPAAQVNVNPVMAQPAPVVTKSYWLKLRETPYLGVPFRSTEALMIDSFNGIKTHPVAAAAVTVALVWLHREEIKNFVEESCY